MESAATFDADATANELGLHVQLGYEIVAKSVAYPFPEHYARQIRAEIDPDFVPLWINKLWRTPNDGIVWTGHHMIARHVRHPRSSAPLVKHLRLPMHREYGIRYENPILEADILDGITETERNQGVLPRYEPFTGKHLRTMAYAMWARNNKEGARRAQEQEQIAAAQIAAGRKAQASELAYRRRHDDGRLNRVAGKGDRVFVSDTLRQLRAAAGMEAVA
jgi:hypothetical protein